MKTIYSVEAIEKVKRQHRDIILIFIVSENYRKVYDSAIGDIAGSLSVADFFLELVDKLLNDGEYEEAVAYALNLVLEGTESKDQLGALIWDYFHVKYNNCLDWYYAGKAKKQIDIYINQNK